MKIILKNNGFTLLELMIAMAISSIVVTGIVTSYNMQVKTKVTQEVIVEAQQNLRAAMYVMTRDIRMAGYDPSGTGNFGIANISDKNGFSQVEFTIDLNEDGTVDNGPFPVPRETISYYIYPSTIPEIIGLPCLGRKEGSNNVQSLAQGIQALGLAYAFDDDGDGQLDTSGGNTIWAIDTDSDGDLDANLDTDGNGVVDTNDTAGGASFTPHVAMGQIRAVRIWILARTRVTRPGFTDNRTYVVGPTRIINPNDNFRRRLLTTTVKCRNMGI